MITKYRLPLAFLLSSFVLATCDGGGDPTETADMPNPASVFCEENGGQVKLRTDETGAVAGVCILPDGSKCDEWEYYRGDCRPGEASTGGAVGLPNLASVFCEENGGNIELRTDETGAVAGVCVFPGGSECDEWEFYRATCEPGDKQEG